MPYNRPMIYTFYVLIISYLFTSGRIFWSKVRPKRPGPTIEQSSNSWKLPSIRHLIKENSLANMSTVATAVAFHISYVVAYAKINDFTDPNSINKGNNYTWLHFLNHIPPMLWNVFVLVMIFNLSPKLRESFKCEFLVFFKLILNYLRIFKSRLIIMKNTIITTTKIDLVT